MRIAHAFLALSCLLGASACTVVVPGAAGPGGGAAGPSGETYLSPADRAREEAAVGDAIDAWHGAAARADEAAYFGKFSTSGVFLGTDATERWGGEAFRTYAHPFFAKGKAWSFRSIRRAVTVAPSGTIAWFDEDLETESLGPARGSGVLVREDGGWKIAQYNLAITVPNERFGEVKLLLQK